MNQHTIEPFSILSVHDDAYFRNASCPL